MEQITYWSEGNRQYKLFRISAKFYLIEIYDVSTYKLVSVKLLEDITE